MENKLLKALKYIENRADAYAVCEPGACHDCDLLIELRDVARNAINAMLTTVAQSSESQQLCLCPLHFGDCEYCDEGECHSPLI